MVFMTSQQLATNVWEAGGGGGGGGGGWGEGVVVTPYYSQKLGKIP